MADPDDKLDGGVDPVADEATPVAEEVIDEARELARKTSTTVKVPGFKKERLPN